MQLTFEYTLDAGAGLFPQVIHTSDNLLRFIYLTSYGTVESVTADPPRRREHQDRKSVV